MKENELRRLREGVARVLREVPNVAAAYAYGSRVHGLAMPMSDLDLAIVLSDDAQRNDPLLAERLAVRIGEVLGTSVEIDARVVDDLPLPVQGRVVTRGVLVYERDPVRRVRYETATRRMYFDFLPFLERDAREGIRARG